MATRIFEGMRTWKFWKAAGLGLFYGLAMGSFMLLLVTQVPDMVDMLTARDDYPVYTNWLFMVLGLISPVAIVLAAARIFMPRGCSCEDKAE